MTDADQAIRSRNRQIVDRMTRHVTVLTNAVGLEDGRTITKRIQTNEVHLGGKDHVNDRRDDLSNQIEVKIEDNDLHDAKTTDAMLELIARRIPRNGLKVTEIATINVATLREIVQGVDHQEDRTICAEKGVARGNDHLNDINTTMSHHGTEVQVLDDVKLLLVREIKQVLLANRNLHGIEMKQALLDDVTQAQGLVISQVHLVVNCHHLELQIDQVLRGVKHLHLGGRDLRLVHGTMPPPVDDKTPLLGLEIVPAHLDGKDPRLARATRKGRLTVKTLHLGPETKQVSLEGRDLLNKLVAKAVHLEDKSLPLGLERKTALVDDTSLHRHGLAIKQVHIGDRNLHLDLETMTTILDVQDLPVLLDNKAPALDVVKTSVHQVARAHLLGFEDQTVHRDINGTRTRRGTVDSQVLEERHETDGVLVETCLVQVRRTKPKERTHLSNHTRAMASQGATKDDKDGDSRADDVRSESKPTKSSDSQEKKHSRDASKEKTSPKAKKAKAEKKRPVYADPKVEAWAQSWSNVWEKNRAANRLETKCLAYRADVDIASYMVDLAQLELTWIAQRIQTQENRLQQWERDGYLDPNIDEES
ncbi:unnamed protein product [Aphanomyces euteiches]